MDAPILRVKQEDGTWLLIPAIRGDKGDAPVLTSTKEAGVSHLFADGVEFAQVADGSPGSDAPATDVQLNGQSIVKDGVANIPIAETGQIGTAVPGLVAPAGSFRTLSGNRLGITNPDEAMINSRTSGYAVTTMVFDYAVKAALKAPSSVYPAYTDSEKRAARERLGLGGDLEFIETIDVSETVSNVTRNMTPSGKAYNFVALFAELVTPPQSAGGWGGWNINRTGTSATWQTATTQRYNCVRAEVRNGRLFVVDIQGASGASNHASLGATGIGLGNKSATTINDFRLDAGNAQIYAGSKINIYGVWA